jgi:shikimate kinase
MSSNQIPQGDQELEIENKKLENETKEEINPKKSKFNILEQGKFMLLTGENSSEENSKNIIIIGPKKSGKTTIFNLLSTGEAHLSDYTHTCGINYGFMRLQKSKKKIINIYEIGGGIENLSRISTLVNNKNLNSTLIFLILDFQTPENALNTLIIYNEQLRKILSSVIEKEYLDEVINSKNSQYTKIKKDSSVNLIPINIYVIGNKYDILEKIEEEKLKWIGLTLRYQCVINGMNLIFYSSNNDKYKNILQSTVSYYAFNQSQIENIYKYSQKNELYALYTQFYNDSLEEIGEPRVIHSSGKSTNDRWIETYNALFMNVKKKNNNYENDIPVDQTFWVKFKENRIDNELKIFDNAKNNNMNQDKINKNKNNQNQEIMKGKRVPQKK